MPMTHLYCQKDAAGQVTALYIPQAGAPQPFGANWTLTPKADPAVGDFLQDVMAQQNPMARSDQAFVRVLDDLIEALVGRNLLQLSDLPSEAQVKFLERSLQRTALTGPH